VHYLYCYIIFSKEISKEQHIFEIEFYSNITVNILTVMFDQFNASLLNKMNFL